MKRRYILMTTSALVAAFATTAPIAACAADAAAAATTDATTIGEVVVTAERFKSTVQTTPVAVSAFSPEMLQQRQVNGVQSFASQIPGLVITSTTGTSTSARIILRGAGQDNNGINFDPGVGVYIDGVYQPRTTGAFFDFFDIDRLEVLRGPQGTLYGRNSSGGAIKIETRKPTYVWHWGGDIAYGSYNLTDARAFISGPILDDKVAFSLSAVSRKRDGFISAPAYGRRVDNKDAQAIRGKLLFNPIEKLEIQLAADYQQDNSDPGVGVVLQAPVGVDTAYATGAGRDLTRTELFGPLHNGFQSVGGSINATYAVNDAISIASITGYRALRSESYTPLFPTLAAQTSGNGAQNSGGSGNFRDHSFSQEVDGTLTTEKIKAVVGAYYFNEKGAAFGFAPYSTVSSQYRGTIAEAIFGQVTYNIIDNLSVTAGVRGTREKAAFTQFYPTQFPVPQSAKKTFKNTSPKFAINWQATPNALGYVSFTKGFKSGGFNPVSPATNIGVIGVAGSPTPYGEEKVDSYEAGVKFTTDDHRIRLNVAVFEAKYKGMQLPVFFPGTSNSYTSNASDATIKGIELEPTWQVTDSLQLYGIMSFQKSKYTSPFVCSTQFGAFTECSDRKIKGVIPAKVVLGGTFTPDLPIPGRVRLAADWDYTDHYYNNVANEGPLVQTPTYKLLNGSITYQLPDGHWSIALEGKNLTNKHYVLEAIQLSNAIRPTVNAFPGDPRVIDVRIKADF